MGWGNFEDPREARAAAAAREQLEAQRRDEDDRVEALAGAIVEGCALIANAILVASGHPPLGGPVSGEVEAAVDAYARARMEAGVEGGSGDAYRDELCESGECAADPAPCDDIDELLDDTVEP